MNKMSIQVDAKRKLPRAAALALSSFLLLCACLLSARPSSAAVPPFEQAGVFSGSASPLSQTQIFGEYEEVEEENPETGEVEKKIVTKVKPDEEIQLGGVGSLAVNRTGAGLGAEGKGAVYAVTITQSNKEHEPREGVRVSMFFPKPAGGLKFVEAWEVNPTGTYERCGPDGELPDGELMHPNCLPRTNGFGGTPRVGIDIDQSTGHVFVYAGLERYRFGNGIKQVIEYTATGSKVLARFAEEAPEGKTIAETPEQVHSPVTEVTPDSIGVNSATGDVYVYDQTGGYSRLMVFEPHESAREEYEYGGEILATRSESEAARAPTFDDKGNLYVASLEHNGVKEYHPPSPAPYPAPAATPFCSYSFPQGGLTAMTVNPETGEPFISSYKQESHLYVIRRLSPCDTVTGKFTETAKFSFAPQRGEIRGLAIDPERKADPTRGEGTLYSATPDPVPAEGTGSVGEPDQTALGYIFAAPKNERHPPLIESQTVASASITTALLRATVNPNGFPTTYAFQYETEAEYEANPPAERFAGSREVPAGGALAGEGTKGIPLSASISQLTPATAYRFRLVAANHGCATEPEELCVEAGEAVRFRTFSAQAPGLPDNRAWELVSPAQKHGGQVFPFDPGVGTCGTLVSGEEGSCKPGATFGHFPKQSAPDGNALAYQGFSFSGEEGSAIENEYVSRRGSSGWQTVDLTPPPLAKLLGYVSFSTDLSRTVLAQSVPTLSPAAPAGYPNLYSQLTADPLAFEPLLTATPTHRNEALGNGFKINYAGASSDDEHVFFAANDALTAEVPGIAPAAPEVGVNQFDLYEWHEGSVTLVSVLPGNATAGSGSFPGVSGGTFNVSADGSHVFFEAAGHLYVRVDGSETREIKDGGKFLVASADSSKLLLSDGCVYSLTEETCLDLTAGKGGFQGLVGRSADLSNIYFIDTKILDASANASGEVAGEGAYNLYSWAEGGSTRFVARLQADDNSGVTLGGGIRDWSTGDTTAAASPDGRYLAFLSVGQPTGYKNIGPCSPNHEGGRVAGPCAEVFLYDSTTESLRCVSCNPTGVAPLGYSVLRRFTGTSRYLDDAGRLYFDSQDSLSPYDTNNRYEDVYQYEPDGVGSCSESEGCVSLISSGREAIDANLLAVDSSGANVFFTTRDRLVPSDRDEAIDVYDAREGGGFASEAEAEATGCQGEACQPQVSAPLFQSPGSSSFRGPGNVEESSPRPCAKGKVKKHGKCVKKQKRRHHNQKQTHRHHNQGAHR